MRSFVVVVILGALLFLADITCLGEGVPASWFGFEAGLIDKDIVDNEEGLGSNLEGKGMVVIISLGWDIY